MVSEELKEELRNVISDRDRLACSFPAETSQLVTLLLVAELRMLRKEMSAEQVVTVSDKSFDSPANANRDVPDALFAWFNNRWLFPELKVGDTVELIEPSGGYAFATIKRVDGGTIFFFALNQSREFELVSSTTKNVCRVWREDPGTPIWERKEER